MPGAAAAERLRWRITSVRRMVFFPVIVGDAFSGGAKLLILRAVAGGGASSGWPVSLVVLILFELGMELVFALWGLAFWVRISDSGCGFVF